MATTSAVPTCINNYLGRHIQQDGANYGASRAIVVFKACYCSEMSRWPRRHSSDSCHTSCQYSTASILGSRCSENSLYEKRCGGARASQLRQIHTGDVRQEISEAVPVKQSRFHEASIAFAPASRTTAVASQGMQPSGQNHGDACGYDANSCGSLLLGRRIAFWSGGRDCVCIFLMRPSRHLAKFWIINPFQSQNWNVCERRTNFNAVGSRHCMEL
jgi:hypothetical protein